MAALAIPAAIAPLTSVRVEHDYEGLRQALVEVFEEDFALKQISPTGNMDAETHARAVDDLPERKLSPGYYARASYLLSLANSIEAGVHYGPSEITHVDVRGLLVVRSARNTFEYEHPACSACGERQPSRFSSECSGCGAKFTRGGS